MSNADQERARKILFKRYWSPEGWARDGESRISPGEFAFAKSAGVMFDPVDLEHDAVVETVRQRVAKTDRVKVVHAFVASLSTRKLEWRSALSSYACALNLPSHRLTQTAHKSCRICGQYPNSSAFDVSILNFERLKWGGVRHAQPDFEMFDLEWFSPPSGLRPTAADWRILSDIVAAIAVLPGEARPRDLDKALKGLLPGNAAERRNVVQALSYCGILIPRDRPTYWGEYPIAAEREAPLNKNDWQYPLLWWRGTDGINQAALADWFPELTQAS